MFIELHIIQNFAPSCLNRDDTNAPKDCEFGGFRRARISSQCIKRAVRMEFMKNLTADVELGKRTKRVIDEEIVKRLTSEGKSLESAQRVATAFVEHLMSKVEGSKTSVLLFLGSDEIDTMSQIILKHWDALEAQLEGNSEESEEKPIKGKKGKKSNKSVGAALIEAAKEYKPGTRAIDVALFGRMMAEHKDMNIDAACQVAHAISTHKVNMEMDYYTAVDDLNPEDEAGAGMIGFVEFNSSCFYRFALVDFGQLKKNLGEDTALARKTIEAFMRASVAAIPTGKQNSMAAQNPPSFVMAVARDGGAPWSLANAFEKPVRSQRKNEVVGFVRPSAEALAGYWEKLCKAYGNGGVKAAPVFCIEEAELGKLADGMVDGLDDLVNKTLAALPSE